MVYLIVKDYSLLKSEIKDFFTISQNNNGINNIQNENIKNKKYSLKTGTSIDVLNNKNIKKNFYIYHRFSTNFLIIIKN